MAIFNNGVARKTKELDLFYPTNTLVTGADIIFFWVAKNDNVWYV